MRLLHLHPEPPPASNLSRCRAKLAPIIVGFWTRRIGATFHNDELRAYVQERAECAPDSPRRVMNDLSNDGVISVRLVDRRGSLYEALPLDAQLPLRVSQRDVLAELRRELALANEALELAQARIRALEGKS